MRHLRAVIALGGVLLIAAHVIGLRHVTTHVALPVGATVVLGVVLVAKHAGIFGVLYDRLSRRS